jgi:hypothetical protein
LNKLHVLNISGDSFVLKKDIPSRELTPEQVSTLHTLYGSDTLIQQNDRLLFVERIQDAEHVEE